MPIEYRRLEDVTEIWVADLEQGTFALNVEREKDPPIAMILGRDQLERLYRDIGAAIQPKPSL